MIEAAHTAYWAALGINGAAVLLFAGGSAFERSRLQRAGVVGLLAALGALTVALALRWGATGHGPYLGAYEAVGSYAWVLMTLYLLLQWRVPHAAPAGLVVAPVAFLLLGAGALSPSAPQFESPAMRSAWLWIHVGMAKVALASLVLAAGVAVVYLRRRQGVLVSSAAPGGAASWWRSDLPHLEELSVRLTSLGFLVLAVVIGAGALWANTAWGSYWNWDPIETWALATWVLYGSALHLHRLWRVTRSRWAWLNIGTLGAAALLFLITRLVTLSPHWVYLQ